MASAEISSIAKNNLFLVFGETDKAKRLAQLERLWHPSGEFLFLEPEFTSTTYEEVDTIITNLQKNTPGFVFTVVGDVQVLASPKDVTVARLKWGFGPSADDFKVTGEDVFEIVGGKIKKLFTFID